MTTSPDGTEPRVIPIVALAQAAAEVPPLPAEADETMVSLYEARKKIYPRDRKSVV